MFLTRCFAEHATYTYTITFSIHAILYYTYFVNNTCTYPINSYQLLSELIITLILYTVQQKIMR